MAPHDRAANDRLVKDEGGVVYAEFLMAFMPIFMLFLGIIQLCFVGASSLVVQNAATKAARAAMVVLPDDPFFYGGEPVLTLDFGGTSDNSSFTDGITGTIKDAGVDSPTADGEGEQNKAPEQGMGGPRLNLIRLTANVALAPIGPDPTILAAWMPQGLGVAGLANAAGVSLPKLGIRKGTIGNHPVARFFTGLLLYNSMAAAINFPKSPGSKELRNKGEGYDGKVVYGKKGDNVTVRITYLYPCTVPIVSRLICQSIYPGPDSRIAKYRRYVEAVANGGKDQWSKAKGLGKKGLNYLDDNLQGAKRDGKDLLNKPGTIAKDAVGCGKAQALGFRDGIKNEAFTLRDGLIKDGKDLKNGLKKDALDLRDGLISDANGLVNGTVSDVKGLGNGLITDGKKLAGNLKGEAQKGVEGLQDEFSQLQGNLKKTSIGVVQGTGDDLAGESRAWANDTRDNLSRVGGGGPDLNGFKKPAQQTKAGGEQLVSNGEKLIDTASDVYRLGKYDPLTYDPVAGVATINRATQTVGRVIETTDDAGRKVVIGLNEMGQQVVTTYEASGAYVTQTATEAGEVMVVAVDNAGGRIESVVDRTGTRIDHGLDEAGNHIIVATDNAKKTVTTTIDNMENRVVETVDGAKGRVIATVDSVGNRVYSTIDSAQNRVDTAYTDAGERIETTYENGEKRVTSAYQNGNEIYRNTVDGVDKCVETFYDEAHNVIDDPTKVFTDRADNMWEDVKKLGEQVAGIDVDNIDSYFFDELRPLTAEEQELMDELHAGTKGQPDLLDLLLLADSARFYVLRREATLPLQSAPYRYPSYKKFENKDKESADAEH